MPEISRVGPKGYIHGYIFVGAPGVGDHVNHPRHGHGTVTEASSSHVKVRFDSGGHHDFPVRPDHGPGHFERMTDEEIAADVGTSRGSRFHAAVAELDRRDRADHAERIRALYAEHPTSPKARDRVYQALVHEGENPEDAWSHAHGVSTEKMQQQAVIAQLRTQGYKGGGFDALARDAFKHDVQRRVLDAETATNGYMLSREGDRAGVDPWSLFTGPEARARKYASSELREWWDQNGRPTVADFEATLMGHAASAGPAGGDFYRMNLPGGELQRAAATGLPARTEVLARARAEGHRAGRAYRVGGVSPEMPGDCTRGPLLLRQAASEWHRGFADGRAGTETAVDETVTVRMSDTWTRRASDLKYGHGSALWEYWTKGAGFAKWSGALHKWTTLRDLLLTAGVPAASADGLTTNIIQAVMPGYMKQAHAAMEHKAGRSGMAKQDVTDSPAPAASRAEYMRLYALEDIHILRSADGGDGRTVEAYAAVFGEPAEIQDHEGHYIEVIDPGAFNRAIDHASRARGGFPGSVKVLWNHGRDLSGTPSDRFSMPIGIPVEIRAEARGLLTRTRYSETPLADEVLENIRAGSITSQSFTGRIMRSDPQLGRGERYRPDRAGNLRTVSRTELGLREYGPVLWPAYSGAEIVGVRMSTPGAYARDPDELDEALPPDEEPAAGDPLTRASGDEHSARYHQHALYVLRSKEARERAGLVW